MSIFFPACLDQRSSSEKQQFKHKWRSVWTNHTVRSYFFSSCYHNSQYFQFNPRNETDASSAAVIVTIYTSESYSNERIQIALTQVLHSAYSALTFDVERYGKNSHTLQN